MERGQTELGSESKRVGESKDRDQGAGHERCSVREECFLAWSDLTREVGDFVKVRPTSRQDIHVVVYHQGGRLRWDAG